MKYLITGGAGFIGSNFIHYLFGKYPDCEIVNLDKLTYAGNLDNLKAYEGDLRYTFIHSDIANPKAVEEAMRDVDIVVNFAAESNVDRSILGPDEFIQTNVVGTQVLLDAAEKHKKRFHHISTDEVFGHIPLDEHYKFDEQTKFDPRSPYAASKAASDHLVSAYYNTYGLEATISNCSNNFGPYQNPEKFIPRAITNVLEGKPVPIYKPGNQIRDWLHVEDHCKAIDLVLQKGKAGETYCVGGQTSEISNKQVAMKILQIMGKDESMLKEVADRPGHDVKYAVDWSKLKKELGWAPQHSFEDWLSKTVEWYVKNESWWKPLKAGVEKFYFKLGR